MPYLFAPPQQAVIPVQDERYEFFPVRRVYCAARNYSAHAAEVARPGEVVEAPFFFMKPSDAVVPVADGETVRIAAPEDPEARLEYEVELVACLSKGGRNLTEEEAEACIWGWCVGIDFTRRDRQREMSAKGRPWEVAKATDRSAPVSHLRSAYRTPMPAPADIYLYKNNEKVQSGRTDQMMVSPAGLIAELSRTWELQPGDIVFTGTPSGVGPVKKGDVLLAGVNGVGTLRVEIV